MKKGTTYLIAIILIIAIISTVLYIKYELPRRRNIQDGISNVSISVRHDGKFVETTIVIQNGDEVEIKTRKGYEFLQLRKGVYNIYNKNITDFYRTKREYNISEDTKRIDFELSKPSKVKIRKQDNGSIIQLEISSENYQNVKICLKYSLNYIFVSSNLVGEDLLDGYEDWDKCYSLEKSIIGTENINISYQVFGMPTEDDYIKVAIIDTDYTGSKYENKLDGVDLGGEDLIVKIK